MGRKSRAKRERVPTEQPEPGTHPLFWLVLIGVLFYSFLLTSAALGGPLTEREARADAAGAESAGQAVQDELRVFPGTAFWVEANSEDNFYIETEVSGWSTVSISVDRTGGVSGAFADCHIRWLMKQGGLPLYRFESPFWIFEPRLNQGDLVTMPVRSPWLAIECYACTHFENCVSNSRDHVEIDLNVYLRKGAGAR